MNIVLKYAEIVDKDLKKRRMSKSEKEEEFRRRTGMCRAVREW